MCGKALSLFLSFIIFFEELKFLSLFSFWFYLDENTIRIHHPERSATVQGDFLCRNYVDKPNFHH